MLPFVEVKLYKIIESIGFIRNFVAKIFKTVLFVPLIPSLV